MENKNPNPNENVVYDPVFQAMYEAKIDKMIKAEKNIPFTKAEIKLFHIGFTRTAVWNTRSYNNNPSKYLSFNKYHSKKDKE